ncbi:uncharacterized protein F4822DRAFT_386571, partial [Hypoxylon trugodes]|uniref:uncharacterized protein n=1 Tax=Hypoxylon trugodes TaxID=326681 RepID=UPI0021973332
SITQRWHIWWTVFFIFVAHRRWNGRKCNGMQVLGIVKLSRIGSQNPQASYLYLPLFSTTSVSRVGVQRTICCVRAFQLNIGPISWYRLGGSLVKRQATCSQYW